MGVFSENAIIGASYAAAAGGGYNIDNSCRFNDDDAPGLTRAAWSSAAANRRTWTFSIWLKLGSTFDAHRQIFKCGGNDSFALGSSNILDWYTQNATGRRITSAKLRDPSAWYHVVLVMDTANGTNDDKMRMYINGERVTDWVTNNHPSLNHQSDLGDGSTALTIGTNGADEWDGYMAEVHFIDGTAVTNADDFGEKGDYGEWKAKEYTGSHGTNGFYLNFSKAGTIHPLTVVGTTQHKTAVKKIGASSIYFDAGTTDLHTTSTGSQWAFGTGDFTVECWIYPQITSGDPMIMGNTYGSYSATSTLWRLYINQSTSTLKYGNSSAVLLTSSSTISNSTWTHIAVTRQSGTTRMYLNGVQDVTVSDSGDLSGVRSFFLGDGFDGGTWLGYIDEVRVSKNCRYPDGTTFTAFGQGGGTISSPTPFEDDSNTIILIHSDTSDTSTTFVDSSGVTGALGNDSSGEDNHLTPTNITASDQMLDTPTNNFCTMNPMDNHWQSATFSEGNLKIATTAAGVEGGSTATMGMSSGKWYWEVYVVDSPLSGGVSDMGIGIMGRYPQSAMHSPGHSPYSWSFYSYPTQNILNNNSYVTYGTNQAYGTGDIISVAVDLVNNKIYWAKNNVYLNSGDPANNSNGLTITAAASTDIGAYMPAFGDHDQGQVETGFMNFGQDGTFGGNKTAAGNADDEGYGNFFYDVPAGFLALCSKNLPDCAVIPSEHYNTIIYDDGAGAKTGVGFQPDLVWLKSRGSTKSHKLTDAVRGVTQALVANEPDIEYTDATGLTAFGSDGFTVGAHASYSDTTGDGMVAWNWKANGSGSSNYNGSINTTSTSANVTAGFSISTYTGTGSNATVGHGLSVAPNLVIVKRRNVSNTWLVGTVQSLVDVDFDDNFVLNTTAAKASSASRWNGTAPTASVFSIGTNTEVNASGSTYVAYCWHDVDGYSKIGSYNGNGNVNGQFEYTGFSPAYVIIKHVTTAPTHWSIYDSARGLLNPVTFPLSANEVDAEGGSAGTYYIDLLSNGFKLRNTNTLTNTNGNWYIYWAFAEMPFKNANAR